MRKVELLPTRDCEAGYGPGLSSHVLGVNIKFWYDYFDTRVLVS